MDNKKKLAFKSVRAILLIAIAVTLSIIGTNFSSTVFSPASKELPIYSVDTQEKKICITFDVNWGDDKTKEILDVLDKYDAKATFYVIGLWCDDYPDLLKEIASRGHEIGNHSNRHEDYTKLSNDAIVKDVEICNAKILDITGKTPETFRFPSGSYNDASVKSIKDIGMKSIQWDVDSIDWKGNGADIEYNRVVSKVKPGSIILFHNNAKYTADNLDRILAKYKDEGYKFVTVSEMVYKDNYYLDHEGKQIAK